MNHEDDDDLRPGMRVTWNHSPRGGYGYVWPTPATVVRTTRERVTLDVERKDGSLVRRTVARKNVRRSSLRAEELRK